MTQTLYAHMNKIKIEKQNKTKQKKERHHEVVSPLLHTLVVDLG
jgi:hypothetical protein